MKQKKLVLIALLLLFVNYMNTVNLLASEQDGSNRNMYVTKDILECINEPEPITAITKNEAVVTFTYDEDKRRIKKEREGNITTYTYMGENIISENRGSISILYFYKTEADSLKEMYDGFIYEDTRYWFGYNEDGRIDYLLDTEGNCICQYMYSDSLIPTVYQYEDGELDLCADPEFVGNINPVRYYGWYYDLETMCYYLGKGIYYDATCNEYINNEYSINEEKLYHLFGNGARSSMPAIVYEITTDYSLKMGSSTFDASAYSPVSESAWNQGQRWYDGVDETEVIARCIYAENTGADRRNDRIAEAVVIANRVAEKRGGNTTAYGVVTARSQFSSINPGTYPLSKSETGNARAAMDKTKAKYQEAILLAITISHTIDHSEISLIYDLPEYIDTQAEFLGVNYVKDYNLFSVQGNQWYYNSNAIKNVAIAGVELISSAGNTIETLYAYYQKGYNVFFNYGTE